MKIWCGGYEYIYLYLLPKYAFDDRKMLERDSVLVSFHGVELVLN